MDNDIWPYLKIYTKEWLTLFSYIFTLTFLFNFVFIFWFEGTINSFLIDFFIFFFLFSFVFISKNYFMKIISYHFAMEYKFKIRHLNIYGFTTYKTLNSKQSTSLMKKSKEFYEKVHKKKNEVFKQNDEFEGINLNLISFMIFILTLGTLIYPNIYKNYFSLIKWKKLGSISIFEERSFGNSFTDLTHYRKNIALHFGMIYFIFLIMIFNLIQDLSQYFEVFLFFLIYLGFFYLFPFPPSEGFFLWKYERVYSIRYLTTIILFLSAIGLPYLTQNFILLIFLNIFLFILVILFYLIFNYNFKRKSLF